MKDTDRNISSNILRNLAGVMTDRAAVMKRFKKDLNEAIQTTLGTEESIEFLECNAHFLLGLSVKTNAACKDIQLERGENRIGVTDSPGSRSLHIRGCSSSLH